MFSIPNVLMGLIGTGIGVWVLVKAFDINHHLLFLGWIEQKYGPGSGTTAYRFLGVGVMIFSMFVMLGYIDLFGAAFGGDFGGGTNQSGTQQVQQTQPATRTNRSRIVE